MRCVQITCFFILFFNISLCSGFLVIPKWDSEDGEEPTTLQPGSLQSLEDKLDLILESERREKDLIQSLLLVGTVESDNNEIETNSPLSSTSSTTSSYKPPTNVQTTTSPNELTAITAQLAENSERVQKMVVFLADLRSVLASAISAQEKEMGLKTEVSELREEVDYLREEIRAMKKSQEERPERLENKLHNGETTMQWLMGSVKELRHELEEVSASVNVTGLLSMRQSWENEIQRVNRDVKSLRKEFEGAQVKDARREEAILEIQGDLAEIRGWEARMGSKFADRDALKAEPMVEPKPKAGQSADLEERLRELVRESSTEDLEEGADEGEEDEDSEGEGDIIESPNRRRLRHRHQRLVRQELGGLARVIREIGKDQMALRRRILKLEWNDLQRKDGEKPKKNTVTEYGASISFRLASLERSSADQSNSIESLNERMDVLEQLRASTTALFKALESLESKYDERLTEMQSGLAKMEARLSKVTVDGREFKEQQDLGTRFQKGLKQELAKIKDNLQINRLRIAQVQTHLVKDGLDRCNTESAQAIKSSLEKTKEEYYRNKNG